MSSLIIRFGRKIDPYVNEHQQYYEEPQRTPDTYYIIPSGTNVIFQDEDGNEITRYCVFLRMEIAHVNC
jgi:hypothetical protein